MAISTAPRTSNEVTETYNEKSDLEMTSHVESTGAVNPLTEDHGEGKLTKEVILAYIVCPSPQHRINIEEEMLTRLTRPCAGRSTPTSCPC